MTHLTRPPLSSAAVCALLILVMFSLSGCASPPQTFDEPRFVSHMNEPDPIFIVEGGEKAAPLKIAGLTAGAPVADLSVFRMQGQDRNSAWLYLLCPTLKEVAIVNNLQDSASFSAGYRKVASAPVGEGASALAMDFAEGFAYVSNTAGNSVSVIDIRSNQTVGTIQGFPAASRPGSMAVKSGKLYVALNAANKVSVVDTATRLILTTIDVGEQPGRISLSPDNRLLYVPNTMSGTVSVIDTLSDTVSTTIKDVPKTRAVAPSRNGNVLHVGREAGTGSESVPYRPATFASFQYAITGKIRFEFSPTYMVGVDMEDKSVFAGLDVGFNGLEGRVRTFRERPLLDSEFMSSLTGQYNLDSYEARVGKGPSGCRRRLPTVFTHAGPM